MPLFGDQPYHAVRVAVSGAGLASSIDEIGKRVEQVLPNETYRTTAGRMADEMRTFPPADEFFTSY